MKPITAFRLAVIAVACTIAVTSKAADFIALAPVGGCPKPLPHKPHHKPHAMECSCLEAYPHTIVLPPEEAIPDPIEIPVYRYYYQLSDNITSDPEYVYAPDPEPVYWIGGGHVAFKSVAAPEIDPACAWSMLVILCGTLAVIRGRK